MTVSTTDSVVTYIAGGPGYAIPYRFLQNSDIEAVLVKQDGTLETLSPAQYTITGAGSQNGGTLTSTYAAGVLATPGASLTISRIMTAVQPTDLRNQGRYFAETHENVFDRLTMLIQQGIAGLSRALVRPIGKNYYDAGGRQIKNLANPTEAQDAATLAWVGDFISGLQGPINNASNVFYQFPNGSAHVVQDLALPDGAIGIGWKKRSVGGRLGDSSNPKDYGAVADGVERPLSTRYATLAAAKVDFPFVTSLAQGLDWAACQFVLNVGGIVDFSGNPRNYSLSQTLVVSVEGTTLNLSGCAFTAASGFTGDLMLSLPANGVTLDGGCTFDCTAMPRPTADFSTASFKGFAFGQKGTDILPYTGLNVTGAIFVKNAPAAAIGMQYCTDFHVDSVYADGCDNSATFEGPGALYFNRCERYSLGDMGATNFKWKGLYNANGTDFSVKTVFCTDGVASQAAIFFASCAGFQAAEMQVRRAFGVKFDRCSDFEASGFHINCAAIGQLGIMVQGCLAYSLTGIFIRGFTTAGIETSYHPGPPAANVLVGKISDFEIRNGAPGSLCGLRMFGSATESAGQLQVSDGYIYACARGVQLRNVGTGVLNRQLSIKDLTIDTFEVAGIEGMSREMSIKNVDFYNAGSSAVGCIDLWHDAGQTCESLSIVGCTAPGLPSAVNFIRAVSTAIRMFKVGTLHIAANSAKGGARFLDLALTQASDYLRVLNISANTHDGSASATSVGLSNAGPSLVPQVCITGNNLLTSAYAKANIAFTETAASAKWNGVVENNMAGVTNKPNNV